MTYISFRYPKMSYVKNTHYPSGIIYKINYSQGGRGEFIKPFILLSQIQLELEGQIILCLSPV